MNGKHPEAEQIEHYLRELPASLEGPDPRRLDAILQQVRPRSPGRTPRRRSRHTWWWLVVALSTGMAAAAIWQQAHRLTAKPAANAQPVMPAGEQKEATSTPSSLPQHRDSENPLSRPDTRFIPK